MAAELGAATAAALGSPLDVFGASDLPPASARDRDDAAGADCAAVVWSGPVTESPSAAASSSSSVS